VFIVDMFAVEPLWLIQISQGIRFSRSRRPIVTVKVCGLYWAVKKTTIQGENDEQAFIAVLMAHAVAMDTTAACTSVRQAWWWPRRSW
jgi:hypothetical protein